MNRIYRNDEQCKAIIYPVENLFFTNICDRINDKLIK